MRKWRWIGFKPVFVEGGKDDKTFHHPLCQTVQKQCNERWWDECLGLRRTRIQGSFGNNIVGAKWSLHITKYFSGDQIKKNELGETCSTYEGGETFIQDLVGNPKGKRPFGSSILRWEYYIRMNLQEVERGHGMNWGGSGYGLAAGIFECCNEISGSVKFGYFLG